MDMKFRQALADVAEIMQFENWLRFYFLHEEGEQLVIRIPEPAIAHFKEHYPHLAPLAEKMNNEPIDYEKSVKTVCSYVVTQLDGPKYPERIVPTVLDSPEFQHEMYLFQVWCQNHERQLEQSPMEFTTWQQLFHDWKQTDQVKKFSSQSSADPNRVANCSTGAMQ